jgi:hypothetical protein
MQVLTSIYNTKLPNDKSKPRLIKINRSRKNIKWKGNGISNLKYRGSQETEVNQKSQLDDFEIEEFFRSLQTLLCSSFNNNISCDSDEYLSRRLDVYERNTNILLNLTRLSESYPLEQQLLSDMRTLQVSVCRQGERCEALSFLSPFVGGGPRQCSGK